ncbi:MAG: hypothetical protein ACI9K5_002569, partial [Gammaproteobacteria bacterium]
MHTYRTFSLSLLALAISVPVSFGQVNEDSKLLASDGAASDYFGYAVGVAGNRVIVGARGTDANGTESGSAYIFDVTTGLELSKLTATGGEPFDIFGGAVGLNGDLVVIGAPGQNRRPFLADTGAVYVFDLNTEQQLFKIYPQDSNSGQRFGTSISVSGDLAAIGAYGSNDQGSQSGTAYVFNARTGTEL